MKRSRIALIALFLGFAGIILSGFSFFHYIALKNGIPISQSLCNISATISCDKVNASPFSTIFGIPLPGLALGFYIIVFLGSFLLPGISAAVVAELLVAVGLFASLLSVILFLISKFVIGALCPSCLGMYLVNFALLLTGTLAPGTARFGERAAKGFRHILAVLKSPFVSDARTSSAQRAGVTAILFIFLTSISAGDFYLMKVLVPDSVREQEHQVAQQALKDWKDEFPVSVSYTSSGPMVDYTKGPGDAPVQIIEFSDFQCPFCRRLYFDIDQLMHDYPGKIKVIHRDFPLDNRCNSLIPNEFHQAACLAASFVRCAGEQGRFWDAAAATYSLPELEETPTQESAAKALSQVADRMGLDVAAMAECQASPRPEQKFKIDIDEAASLGLEGTPFIIINGKKLKGVSAEALKLVVADILTKPARTDP